VKHDKEKKITYSVNQKYELTSRQCQLLNNFKLALIIVLLEVRKDVKLTTLGGLFVFIIGYGQPALMSKLAF